MSDYFYSLEMILKIASGHTEETWKLTPTAKKCYKIANENNQ